MNLGGALNQAHLMASEELLTEIDTTLDQLICNAEALSNIDIKELSDIELEAFQKTQESLIHHLLHVDQRVKVQQIVHVDQRSAIYKIQEKRLRFEKLHSSYRSTVANS